MSNKSLSVDLPPGFSLRVGDYVIHLLCGGEKVASFFCSAAHPVILRSVAEAYCGGHKP
jgi:hypothetical protein